MTEKEKIERLAKSYPLLFIADCLAGKYPDSDVANRVREIMGEEGEEETLTKDAHTLPRY